MAGTVPFLARAAAAFRRARRAVVWVACAYAIGTAAGLIAVHTGNPASLAYRDRIVARARDSSTILRQADQGHPLAAASLDFAANLFAASATAAAGWWAPAPFPILIYRGWIGGIVSVDSKHRSRFRALASGAYYSIVLVLQLLAYILAGGAGVNLGLARAHPRPEYQGARFLSIPVQACKDAGYIYLAVIPTFAIASALEFFWHG